MFYKIVAIIKNYFLITVPESDRKEFNYGINRINLTRAKITSSTFILLEVLILISSMIFKKDNALYRQVDMYYTIFYFVMLIFMVIYYLIFRKLDHNLSAKNSNIMVAGVSFAIFILLWCASISLLDQFSSGQIIVYTVAVISIAVTPLFSPFVLLMIYLPCHIIFVTILISSKTMDNTFSNYINSTSFLIISMAISRMRYKHQIQDFINNKELKKKTEDLVRVNKQLEEVNLKLEVLSHTDSLTGIFNRSVFDNTINAEWEKCKHQKEFLSLIMIDLDLFKFFNDTYGHQAGDECLKKVADVLSHGMRRSSDVVTRYGGEEFAIILPHTDRETSFALAEDLRCRVDALHIAHAYSAVSNYVTISLGVCSIIPSDNSSIFEFIGSADKALYEAKSKSRNTVTIAEYQEKCVSQ